MQHKNESVIYLIKMPQKRQFLPFVPNYRTIFPNEAAP